MGQVVRQARFRVPHVPAMIRRPDGGIIGDDEARKRLLRRLVLRAVSEPEHVPPVAVRGPRLRRGRVEEMAAPQGELRQLGLQPDVPVGVVFDDQGGREVVVEDCAGGVHVCAPAAGYAGGLVAFFVKARPGDVGEVFAVDAWDYLVGDSGDGGHEADGIQFVGPIEHVDEVDVAEAEGTVIDCVYAVLGERMGELGACRRTRF